MLEKLYCSVQYTVLHCLLHSTQPPYCRLEKVDLPELEMHRR